MLPLPPWDALQIRLEQRADLGLTIVELAGELDLAVAAELRRVILALPSTSVPDVVTDLRRVEFMDCTALSTLVGAHQRAEKVGGRLHTVGAPPQSRRLLELTRLDTVFCRHDDLESALVPHALRR